MIKKIIYVIVAVFFLYLMGKTIYQASGDEWTEIKSNLVVLDKPESLPENEGKLVMLTFTPKVDSTLYDPEFDLEVKHAFRLTRKAQTYRYYSNPSNEDDIRERWESASHSEEFGIGNVGDMLEDETFTQDILLGDFIIPADQLNYFGTSTTLVDLPELASIEEQLEEDYIPFIKDGIYYTSCIDGMTYVGDCRVRYEYASVDKIGTMTVLGMQSNGQIVPWKMSTGKQIYELLEGDVSMRTILNNHKQDRKNAFIGMAVVLLILIIVGCVVFRDELALVFPNISMPTLGSDVLYSVLFMIFGCGFLTVCSLTPLILGISTLINASNLDRMETATAYVSSYTENNAGYYNYDYYYIIDGATHTVHRQNVSEIPFYPKETITEDGDVAFGEFTLYYDSEKPDKMIDPEKADFFDGLLFVGAGLFLGFLTCLAWRNSIENYREAKREVWKKKYEESKKRK